MVMCVQFRTIALRVQALRSPVMQEACSQIKEDGPAMYAQSVLSARAMASNRRALPSTIVTVIQSIPLENSALPAFMAIK